VEAADYTVVAVSDAAFIDFILIGRIDFCKNLSLPGKR
jgi:hypothetical protein